MFVSLLDFENIETPKYRTVGFRLEMFYLWQPSALE